MAARNPPAVLSPSEMAPGACRAGRLEVRDGKLHRQFVFANFVEAFGFMARAALVAERSDHHPEWFNVYRTVRVDLTTHESSGITARDVDLARAMNELAG